MTNTQAPLAGVVVTYFPDAEFGVRLAAIAREVDRLIVIDNCADPAVQAQLAAVCAACGAQLILNPENCGLAAALNQTFALLAEEDFAWVAAFDQDSTPLPGFAAALIAAARVDPNVAVIGANWLDEGRPGFPSRHLRRHPRFPLFFQRPVAESDLDAVTCVITSGSLFHLPTWRALGGFDQDLFLDLVDTDYCLRARRAGNDVRVAAGAQLLHRRGAKRAVRFLGRMWWPASMPPLRLRYLFRNRILLMRRHGGTVPHWVAFEMVYAAKISLEVLLLEDGKFAKLAACLRGTWDGLRGRSGRITRGARSERGE